MVRITQDEQLGQLFEGNTKELQVSFLSLSPSPRNSQF